MNLKYVKQNSCPTDETLQAYLTKKLAGQDYDTVQFHLQFCEACLESLRQLPDDYSDQLSAEDLADSGIDEDVEISPELAHAIERFRERETSNLAHPPSSWKQIDQAGGLQVGQVWRTLLSDINIPGRGFDEPVTASALESTPHLVLVTSAENGQGEPRGGFHIIHVAPISPEIEYAAEGDLVTDEANSPLGYSMMIELWNEQPMLRENLESCLGTLNQNDEKATTNLLQEKSHERRGNSAISPPGRMIEVLQTLREIRKNVQPPSRQEAVRDGSYRDPVVRFRSHEYEETAYLRVPVESLLESLSRVEPDPRSSFWERFLAVLQIPEFTFGRIGVAAAVAALVVAVLAPLFVWRSMRSELVSRNSQIGVLQQQKTELEKQASRANELEEQVASLRKEKESTRQTTVNNRNFVHLPSLAPSTRTERLPQVAVNDAGRRIGLDKEGRVTGLENAPQSVQLIARQALNGEIKPPEAIKTLSAEDSENNQTRGSFSGPRREKSPLEYPIGTVVRTNQPTFKWKPVSGAKYYVVSITTPEFRPRGSSEHLQQTEWTANQPLPGDVRYYKWQVDVYLNDVDPPNPFKGRFAVIDPAKEEELKAAEQQFPNSHLLLGSLYAKAGLLDDAQREFQLLLKANPKSSIAKKLLRAVQKSHHAVK